MTGIQPELWVDRPSEAITFYQAAFGATVVHQPGKARTSSRSFDTAFLLDEPHIEAQDFSTTEGYPAPARLVRLVGRAVPGDG